jgi:HEAT repeat protein
MSEQKVFDAAMVLLKKEANNAGGTAGPGVRFPLHWLSDLGRLQVREFLGVWRKLPAPVRRDLISRMEDEARANFELDFTAIAHVTLDDADGAVRMHAIRTLWECEDPRLIDRLLRLMEKDPEADVRSAAASALGMFVEGAELEKIPSALGAKIVERLKAVAGGTDVLDVRRHAVESVGYSSEPGVHEVLEIAYRNPEELMKSSALFGMGRSADTRWSDTILKELVSRTPALRAEAARAAGELSLAKSVLLLIEMLEDLDGNVRWNAIYALGEIGGDTARRALEKLQSHSDGDEWDRIEEALENAEFQDSVSDLPLLELDDDEEEGDDLDEDEEDEEGEEEE